MALAVEVGFAVTAFAGIRRLYGDEGLARLRAAHVLVVGVGGVGSWTAEALARSAVGAMTLLDGDDVCVSNINRQAHALGSQVGRPKVAALADRVRDINPECNVTAVQEFFRKNTVEQHLAAKFTAAVDAADSVSAKAYLIAGCRERGIPVVTCGGAGGKLDPGRIEVADLSETRDDPLLTHVRKLLRQRLGFPRGKRKFGVPCVFSTEPILAPDGCQAEGDGRLNCEGRLGSITHVTGVFGFIAASEAIRLILQRQTSPSAV